MPYVYQAPQHSVQVERRRRSPLGNLTAWCVSKAAGTALQRPVSFLASSKLGRMATAITVALALGALLDLSFHFAPTTRYYIVCGLLGAAGGGGAQGAGGAVVGALWGWLAGKITDAVASRLTAEAMGEWSSLPHTNPCELRNLDSAVCSICQRSIVFPPQHWTYQDVYLEHRHRSSRRPRMP